MLSTLQKQHRGKQIVSENASSYEEKSIVFKIKLFKYPLLLPGIIMGENDSSGREITDPEGDGDGVTEGDGSTNARGTALDSDLSKVISSLSQLA